MFVSSVCLIVVLFVCNKRSTAHSSQAIFVKLYAQVATSQ